MSLRDQLEAVRMEYGRLDPPLLVNVARAEDHPLHGEFEWDDSLAGEAHRRRQAHELIQGVRIVHTRDGSGPRSLRAYVAVPQPDSAQPDYRPLEEVARDEFAAKIVLQAAEREWRTLKTRYGHLVEFIDMVRQEVA